MILPSPVTPGLITGTSDLGAASERPWLFEPKGCRFRFLGRESEWSISKMKADRQTWTAAADQSLQEYSARRLQEHFFLHGHHAFQSENLASMLSHFKYPYLYLACCGRSTSWR